MYLCGAVHLYYYIVLHPMDVSQILYSIVRQFRVFSILCCYELNNGAMNLCAFKTIFIFYIIIKIIQLFLFRKKVLNVWQNMFLELKVTLQPYNGVDRKFILTDEGAWGHLRSQGERRQQREKLKT